MALSKLAISLIAGIGSVVTVGGITAGVVVSRNNTVVEAIDEADKSNSNENKSSDKKDSLVANEPRIDLTDNISSTGEMKDAKTQSMSQAEPRSKKEPIKTDSRDEPVQTSQGVSSNDDNSHSRNTDNQGEDEADPGTEEEKLKKTITEQGSPTLPGDVLSRPGETEHSDVEMTALAATGDKAITENGKEEPQMQPEAVTAEQSGVGSTMGASTASAQEKERAKPKDQKAEEEQGGQNNNADATIVRGGLQGLSASTRSEEMPAGQPDSVA